MRSDSESAGLIDALAGMAGQTSGWELLAVLLSITYLLLAVRQNRWCWAAALASTSIFSVLFWHVQLPMQAVLNAYYMAMAVYGWWHWTHGAAGDGPLAVTRLNPLPHLLLLAATLAVALPIGALLDSNSDAARPYLDSLISIAAVVATFMVARKALENWAWWMVINSLAVWLFIDRGLLPTAGLHLAYLVISVFGWRRWTLDYRNQQNFFNHEDHEEHDEKG